MLIRRNNTRLRERTSRGWGPVKEDIIDEHRIPVLDDLE